MSTNQVNKSDTGSPPPPILTMDGTSSLEQSVIIDTTETVGMRMSRSHITFQGDEPRESISNLSIGFHPCICCNVSLATGVLILATLEIVKWSILLCFSAGALIYWVTGDLDNKEVHIGSKVHKANDPEFFSLLSVLVAYTIFCGVFVILGIILFVGVKLANRKLVLVWLFGTFSVEILRMVFAIISPEDSVRYALLYWLLRLYEFWAIFAFSNTLKPSGGTTKSRRFSRWRRRKLKKQSSVPALVPITYYGIFREHSSDSNFNVLGYELAA